MEEQIKKIEKRDDGYVEVVFKKIKDFDEYVFAQLNKDDACLTCFRDSKSKLKLFYDTKGYLELSSYLQEHVFEGGELLNFLIYLFEHLIQANTQKPVYLHSAYIFVGYEIGDIKFVTLPLTMDKWIFQKEQSREFLKNMIMEVTVKEGYVAIGYLVEILKRGEVTFPQVLQGLWHLKEATTPKKTWLDRFRRSKKEETYYIRDIPKPAFALMDEKIEPVYMETMVLFAQSSESYLIDQRTTQTYPITKENFTIGRNKENDLCIQDSYVSSKHAVLYQKDARLLDLKSSNGTLVNQQAIQECKLQDGDLISFAGHEFLFQTSRRPYETV